MNTGVLNDLKFPYPPIELQNQFAERVQAIEQQKSIAQRSLEKSEALFNSLLQKAFKGELV
jgi:type I restriction enzyme S subunit